MVRCFPRRREVDGPAGGLGQGSRRTRQRGPTGVVAHAGCRWARTTQAHVVTATRPPSPMAHMYSTIGYVWWPPTGGPDSTRWRYLFRTCKNSLGPIRTCWKGRDGL
ncbi:hypothetical protein AMTR_s00012p00246850 [Amborella trichopoda]|uniref:Uncharacterized protein n=1 Tax=Amborella trichopoda TaxID=13333 RepID=W1PJV1_AMBTC|nr:hypothetical protein AMTR_s00012p00246850 [Amborella trichopoda]